MELRHRTLIANLQYPRFTGSPAFGPRAVGIAALVDKHRCDSAVFGEAGYDQCQRLAGVGDYPDTALTGWDYDRAQGRGRGVIGEGLNSAWTEPGAFTRGDLSDYSLPSFGQWQRTALGVRLVDQAGGFATLWSTHLAAKGAPLTQLGADRALAAQIRYLEDKIGERRSVLGGDLPRTNSADDLAWLVRQGWRVPGRTGQTPLAVAVQGRVTVHNVWTFPHGRLFDHDYRVAEWSVPGVEQQA